MANSQSFNRQIVEEMFTALKKGPKEVMPSLYWDYLNEKNIKELSDSGFQNFKRTIALNYFTWVVTPFDKQLIGLAKRLPFSSLISAIYKTCTTPKHDLLNRKKSLSYTLLTHLVWEQAKVLDTKNILDQIQEPSLGNPPQVLKNGRLISQDLANSFIEYQSIANATNELDGVKTVLELGAGYGRDAFLFLSLHKNIKYIIVDIPPALFVAQKYLSGLFPDRNIFRFRDFQSYDEIKEEFEKADIAFLVPSQLQSLSNGSVDLFINISSLHEMRIDQIKYYFKEITRLTSKYFYTKQWKISNLPKEDITIKAEDYPIPEHWKEVFNKECLVQPLFFEALYQV